MESCRPGRYQGDEVHGGEAAMDREGVRAGEVGDVTAGGDVGGGGE